MKRSVSIPAQTVVKGDTECKDGSVAWLPKVDVVELVAVVCETRSRSQSEISLRCP